MPFEFRRLPIPEVVLIVPRVFEDERGFFMESYKCSAFEAFGVVDPFVQDNHSRSRRGVLRGLHFQRQPKAQGKLVRAVVGEIFDVAVDIRVGSASYGEWVSALLSAENQQMLYVPAGFAHGFCVLSEVAEVSYKATEEYSPEHDAGIRWDDPEIGIEWPIDHPVVSAKDAGLPLLSGVTSAGFGHQ
jgi:dTDP-4-dehydrorhamnose 3,5-epimerase